MKRPVNFNKIDRIDFEFMGHSFRIDLDALQNKSNSNWVWVFPDDGILGDYVVLFEMKWEHDCYSMKKCVSGEGTTGDYIFQDKLIQPGHIVSKDEFVNHMKWVIGQEIGVGTFQN